MVLQCKKPIVDTAGNILFYAGYKYKAKLEGAMIILRDEKKCMRHFTEADKKFLKEHFEEVKEKAI
jgi:hypothetical protein